jgi:hypothetical protein
MEAQNLPFDNVGWFGWFMVFNATFNNISVLMVEATRVPGEIHQPVASH